MLRELGAEVIIGDSIGEYIWALRKRFHRLASDKLANETFETISAVFDKFHDCEQIEDFLAIKLREATSAVQHQRGQHQGAQRRHLPESRVRPVKERYSPRCWCSTAPSGSSPEPAGTFLKSLVTRVPIESDVIITCRS